MLLNYCSNVTIKGIIALLIRLKLLERIEANKDQESSVQQAIDSLDADNRLENFNEEILKSKSFSNMKDFVFRNPRAGLETVAKFCPSLTKVQIYSYSIAE